MQNKHILMTLAGMLLLLLTACTGQSSGSDQLDTHTPQIFARAQQPEDTRSINIAAIQDDHDAEIDPASIRLLGRRGEESFHAARTDNRALCLIIAIEIGDRQPTSARSCTGPAQFAQNGKTVSLETGQHDVTALFFPDGYTERIRATFPDAFVRDNLLVFEDDEAVADAIATHGEEVVLAGDGADTFAIPLAALK